MLNRITLALLCSLLLTAPCSALTDDARARLHQSITESLAAFHGTSVSVAVVDQGKLAYAEAFGSANLEKPVAATPQTRYAVGSISKQFTAAALLLAQEQGKLSIDDKVAKYFPDLTRAKEITIRQLLSHTSGYEDFAPQDYIIPAWTHPTTAEATMNNWARKPLNFDPGTKWQYSNTNYVIAGAILEKATGERLLSFLQEHIFAPLDMQTAGEWIKPGGADADAYTRFALGPPRPVAREGAGWYFAAGELSMTPSDLAKWDLALLSHKILAPKSYAELVKEVKLKNGESTHYALGIRLDDSMGTPAFEHGGEVSGFLADNAVYPEKNAAVVVLSNEDGLGLTTAVMRQVSSILLGAATNQDTLVRQVLEGLTQGRLDAALFTSDALAYFTPVALEDYKSSLAPLGKLLLLAKLRQGDRGGMTQLTYRATFEKKRVALNIYLLPDGKIEQFLVEEQL